MSVPAHEAADRCRAFHQVMDRRRTVRDYATRPLPEGVLEWAVRTAATAPSGAHVQPWRFVVITDPERKRRLREAAEAEERAAYVIPVGYPAEDARVPDLVRKPLDEVMVRL
ncbi:nitroreductase family protein [Kitasatospora phosalacinea]|uniref:nitroreductase family protein n=1 Tax=Kitasatospora phosalacinea TaxID=2065 RepID=UPI000B09F8C7|nr:nitroreductase family protein [Kitasatospora phosalacinea]